MTSLTFYGGVNEIGGNKILLQDKDTKIFLDFGKGFTGLGKLYCRLKVLECKRASTDKLYRIKFQTRHPEIF